MELLKVLLKDQEKSQEEIIVTATLIVTSNLSVFRIFLQKKIKSSGNYQLKQNCTFIIISNVTTCSKQRTTAGSKISRRNLSYQYLNTLKDTFNSFKMYVREEFFFDTLDINKKRISYFFDERRQ